MARTLRDGLVRVSPELQLGKAAEHLACADLLLRGHAAFLSDAGMPYDVVVDVGGGKLVRIQVKATRSPLSHRGATFYRFGLRRGRRYGRVVPGAVDVFAFVALDLRRVAYVLASSLLTAEGRTVGLVEFANEAAGGRRGWGRRTFDKCSAFPPVPHDPTKRECFSCGGVYPATPEYFEPNPRCRGGITGICRECRREDDRERKREKRAKEA